MDIISNTKAEGFVGERMTIIPKEILSKYHENVFVKRLYLTDVGFFPTPKAITSAGLRAWRSIFFSIALPERESLK